MTTCIPSDSSTESTTPSPTRNAGFATDVAHSSPSSSWHAFQVPPAVCGVRLFEFFRRVHEDPRQPRRGDLGDRLAAGAQPAGIDREHANRVVVAIARHGQVHLLVPRLEAVDQVHVVVARAVELPPASSNLGCVSITAATVGRAPRRTVCQVSAMDVITNSENSRRRFG